MCFRWAGKKTSAIGWRGWNVENRNNISVSSELK